MSYPADREVLRKRVEKFYKERSDFIGHLITFLIINGIFWVLGLRIMSDGGFPWPAIISFAWGSGLLAHLISLDEHRPARLVAQDRAIDDQMTRLYGPNWEIDGKEHQRVTRAMKKEYKDRIDFAGHLGVYVMINLMLWFIMLGSGASFPFPLIVMAAWGIGLGSHAMSVYFSSSQKRLARDEAIEREIDRLAGVAAVEKKKKRDRLVLGDEVLEVRDAEPDEGLEDEDSLRRGSAR